MRQTRPPHPPHPPPHLTPTPTTPHSDPGSVNFTYYFNVCGNVNWAANPTTGQFCNVTYPGSGINPMPPPAGFPPSISGPAGAYQIDNLAQPGDLVNKCHRLGGAVDRGNFSWGLADTTDPSRGVYLQYKFGDYCGAPTWNSQNYRARTMRVWLYCYNDVYNVPDEEVVLESDMCTYDIFVNTASGCPLECPFVPNPTTSEPNLCNGHGVCGFDSEGGKARCFCNGGYSGPDCTLQLGA